MVLVVTKESIIMFTQNEYRKSFYSVVLVLCVGGMFILNLLCSVAPAYAQERTQSNFDDYSEKGVPSTPSRNENMTDEDFLGAILQNDQNEKIERLLQQGFIPKITDGDIIKWNKPKPPKPPEIPAWLTRDKVQNPLDRYQPYPWLNNWQRLKVQQWRDLFYGEDIFKMLPKQSGKPKQEKIVLPPLNILQNWSPQQLYDLELHIEN